MDIIINDKELTKSYCIALFAVGIQANKRIVRIHCSKDTEPSSVIHLYFKGGPDSKVATIPLTCTINNKSCVVPIPKSFKDATCICVDLFEHDEETHPCYKRRYASCSVTALNTVFPFIDHAVSDIKYGSCTIKTGFNNLRDELKITLDKLVEAHSDCLAKYPAEIRASLLNEKASAVERIRPYFNSLITAYQAAYQPHDIRFAVQEVNNQFFSPLYINNRILPKVFVFNFVRHIVIPCHCDGTKVAFEKLFAGKDTDEQRVLAIHTWVHNYFAYSSDHHHNVTTNVYISGFVQDTLNCKDMAITVYQLLVLAQYYKFIDSKTTFHLLGCIIIGPNTNIPHMIAACKINQEYFLVDATSKHNKMNDMVITSLFSENSSCWVIGEQNIYGVDYNVFRHGRFTTKSKYYITREGSMGCVLQPDEFHLKMENLCMLFESPCLAINNEFPSKKNN